MKRIMNKLYFIFGASGSGKTTLLQNIVYKLKLCGSVQKYSTRNERADEIWHDGTVIKDDAKHLEQHEIEKKCDVIYESNGYQYGFDSKEVAKALLNQDIVVVLSDVRAIKVLKEKVGNYGFSSKVIYLSSKMDSPNEFIATWQKRIDDSENKKINNNEITYEQSKINKEKLITKLLSANDIFVNDLKNNNQIIPLTFNHCSYLKQLLPESSTYNKREEKIRLMYTRYIHNITLFDYVILNYSTVDDMLRQAENIITFNKSHTSKKRPKGPVIFMICASPKSGKGTLMQNLNIMGASKIQITPKYASKNPPKTNEEILNTKRDGMVMKGEDWFNKIFHDEESSEYWKWRFHQDANNPAGTAYAVKIEQIINRLKNGISQVFTSNFIQVERLRKDKKLQNTLKGVHGKIVVVYLHRVRDDKTLDEQFRINYDDSISDVQKKKVRKLEVNKVYQQYINNITSVDHVIINPSYLTYSEDIHDQMMTLIELYSNFNNKKNENNEKNMVLITGGSGVGKTFILNNIDKLGNNYEVLKKITTRQQRKNELTPETTDLILCCEENIVKSCDFVYSYRNEYYGFNKIDIDRILDKGKVPLFVVRRTETIKELKKIYPFLKVIHCKSGLNREDLRRYLLSMGDHQDDIDERMFEEFEQISENEYINHQDIIDYHVTNNYDELFIEEIKVCLSTIK